MDIDEFSKILISCESKGADFFELHNDLTDITLVKDKLLIVNSKSLAERSFISFESDLNEKRC